MRVASVFALILVCLPVAEAKAWNGPGHKTVALLAYRDLSPNTRAKIHDLLQRHPHYEEFLSQKAPEGVKVDEWAFLNVATWPDWVRPPSKYAKKFHVGDRHFTNVPFILEGHENSIDKNALKPKKENVLAGLERCMKILGDETVPAEERSIDLCWLLHLLGDVHQPLHCVSFFSAQFSQGDQGGNSFF